MWSTRLRYGAILKVRRHAVTTQAEAAHGARRLGRAEAARLALGEKPGGGAFRLMMMDFDGERPLYTVPPVTLMPEFRPGQNLLWVAPYGVNGEGGTVEGVGCQFSPHTTHQVWRTRHLDGRGQRLLRPRLARSGHDLRRRNRCCGQRHGAGCARRQLRLDRTTSARWPNEVPQYPARPA